MRKIWLLLIIFALATSALTATLLTPDSSAVAQSTPSATEEAEEEAPGEATAEATTEVPIEEPTDEATEEPTGEPTGEVTEEPIEEPAEEPTGEATEEAIEASDQTTQPSTTPASAGTSVTGTESITGTEAMTATGEMSPSAAMTQPLIATADMQDVDGNIVGKATFHEDGASHMVSLTVEISGLQVMTAGEHGIHVHQVGLCTPDFQAAGSHFNPTRQEHGLENPDGPHAGDLPNIKIDEEGNATYAASTNLFTLSDGPNSLLVADGSALMIHAMADDQTTDPSGKSGARIACGVLVAEGFPGADTPQSPPPTENATLQPAQRAATPENIAQLQVTEGFSISVFAKGVDNVRMMAQDDNGIVYVTRPAQGDVIALMDEDGDGVADSAPMTATSELTLVHGIVISGNQVYLATPTTIYSAEIVGDGTFGELTTLVDDLPDGGQHGRRTMGFGPDGLLYISIGSACNECADPNPERATILQVQPDGSTRTIFAAGLRNTLGFAWHPETQEMWGMDHGSDGHGNDVPNEELNRVEMGNNYGWPFCFNDNEVNAYIAVDPPGLTKAEFCAQGTAPTLTYQAHSAPIGFVFYTGDQFPDDYQNDAFVAMRGSWNRMPATGYKVVRVLFDEAGQPTEFEDFVAGFLIEDGMAHFGRVAGLLVLNDGSLLIAEDTNGMIYRVSYAGVDAEAETDE